MNCLFIVTANATESHHNNHYLLMLAMLNYDFTVDVVFINNSLSSWKKHPTHKQNLSALQLYGAHIHELSTDLTTTNKPGHFLDFIGLNALKKAADIIL